MLVLTRRAGESIVIGDDVRVVVLDVRGDTVRLGIEAPRSIQVHRSEVYAEVQAANAAAATQAGDLGGAAERLRRIARGGVPRQATRRPAAGPARDGHPGARQGVPAGAAPARPDADGRPAAGQGADGRPASPQPARPKPGPPPVPRPGPPAERPDQARPVPQPPAPRPAPPADQPQDDPQP